MGQGFNTFLLVGSCDPLHLGYSLVADALLRLPGNGVWVCPIGPGGEAAKAQAMAFCANHPSPRKLTCCTAGLDAKLSAGRLVEWLSRRYDNDFVFVPMWRLRDEKDMAGVQVMIPRFRGEDNTCQPGQSVIAIGQPRLDEVELLGGLASGNDESTNFPPAVWGVIKKNRFYERGLEEDKNVRA